MIMCLLFCSTVCHITLISTKISKMYIYTKRHLGNTCRIKLQIRRVYTVCPWHRRALSIMLALYINAVDPGTYAKFQCQIKYAIQPHLSGPHPKKNPSRCRRLHAVAKKLGARSYSSSAPRCPSKVRMRHRARSSFRHVKYAKVIYMQKSCRRTWAIQNTPYLNTEKTYFATPMYMLRHCGMERPDESDWRRLSAVGWCE